MKLKEGVLDLPKGNIPTTVPTSKTADDLEKVPLD